MPDAATLTQQVPTVEGHGAPAPDALSLRLGEVPAAGPTAAARAGAAARLRAMGLPRPRDEYWRYTDPAPFNAASPTLLPLDTRADSALFADVDRLRLTFVDGRFDPAESDDLALSGVEILPLSRAEAQPGFVGFLMDIIPTTIVDAFAKGAMLQIILISLLLGLALVQAGERGKPVVAVIDSLLDALFLSRRTERESRQSLVELKRAWEARTGA